MNTEMIRQELQLFWQKLSFFFGQFLEFVRQVAADPSIVERSDLIMMGATALIVGLFLVGGLIRFFTEPWKKKGQSLLRALLVLLILAVAAFFVLRRVPLA